MTKSTQQLITVLLVAMALVHSGLADVGNLDSCTSFIGENYKTLMTLRLPRSYFERINAYASYTEIAVTESSGCKGLSDEQFTQAASDILGETQSCYTSIATFYSTVYSKDFDSLDNDLKAAESYALSGSFAEIKATCVGPQSS